MDDFPSDASNGLGDDELLLSGNSSATEENNESSNDRLFDSEDSMSDAHHFVNEALCKQYMKECSRLEMLKKKLISSLSHNVSIYFDFLYLFSLLLYVFVFNIFMFLISGEEEA